MIAMWPNKLPEPSAAGAFNFAVAVRVASRRWFGFPLLAIILLSFTCGCSVARPLHRSEANIRASLLKRTPLGMSKRDVETFITKEGWHPESQPGVLKGAHSAIEVDFGGYTIWFGTCYVYGLWGFDNDDRLIELSVSKSRDVL